MNSILLGNALFSQHLLARRVFACFPDGFLSFYFLIRAGRGSWIVDRGSWIVEVGPIECGIPYAHSLILDMGIWNKEIINQEG